MARLLPLFLSLSMTEESNRSLHPDQYPKVESRVPALTCYGAGVPYRFDIIENGIGIYNERLIILGGIVVVRTILSVFLNKEIKELETENN